MKKIVFIFVFIFTQLSVIGSVRNENLISSAINFMDSVIQKDQNIRYVYGSDYSIEAVRGLSIRSAVLWIRSQLNDSRPIMAIEEQPHFSYVIDPDGNKEKANQTIAKTNNIINEAKFSYYNFDEDKVIKQLLDQDTIVIKFGISPFSELSSVRVVLNVLMPPKLNSVEQYTIHFEYQWGLKPVDNNEIYFFDSEEMIYILENGEGILKVPDSESNPNWYLNYIDFYDY